MNDCSLEVNELNICTGELDFQPELQLVFGVIVANSLPRHRSLSYQREGRRTLLMELRSTSWPSGNIWLGSRHSSPDPCGDT